MSERRFTAEEVDDAVAALTADPARFGHAQEIVTHAAPGLQRILNETLASGGFFDQAHEAQVAQAADAPEGDARRAAVRTLVAEETRLGMLIGAAIGLELGRELHTTHADSGETT